jgi:hypothetical protein
MRVPTRCLLVGLTLVWAGCAQRKCYVVEMSPQDDGLARTLTCWLEKGGQTPEIAALPQEDLARLEKLYGRPGTTDASGKRVFAAEFDAQTPSDVGGAGAYARYVTPFGTLWTYMERFRGDADLGPGREKLDANLTKQRAAADQIVDLVVGWLQQEMGQDPAFPRVRQFLDKDLRGDLKSLLLFGWAHNVAAGLGDASEEELVARAVQFLVERGYLRMTDVPAVFRIELASDTGQFLILVQRLLARKMGVGDRQPIPASLAFLSDPRRVAKSFASYVQKTEFFQKRVEAWKQRQKNKPKPPSPPPAETATPRPGAAPPVPSGQPDARDQEPTPEGVLEDLLGEMIGDWFDFQIFGAPDHLGVKLHCGTEPLASNGEWDEEARTVVWSAELKAQRLLPFFCFAIWCRPDQAAQEKHFGSLVLEGDDLAEYAMWYCGLTKTEALEWDRLVATLKADGNWRRALEEFRFTSDPKFDPNNPQTEESLADEPKLVILKDEWRSKRTPGQPRPGPASKGPTAPPPAPAPAPAPPPPARGLRTPGR